MKTSFKDADPQNAFRPRRMKCAKIGCPNHFVQKVPHHRFCSGECQVTDWQNKHYGLDRITELTAEVAALRRRLERQNKKGGVTK